METQIMDSEEGPTFSGLLGVLLWGAADPDPFSSLCLLGIRSQPHSCLDLASVDPHIWPYSLPDSLAISPEQRLYSVFINTVQAPLQQDQDFRLCPECFPSPSVPIHGFCRDLWWFPLQEQVSHAEEGLAGGSSLEEDMGWEVAVHALPGATGL